jgi:AcrR family transcriptional regulator
MTKRTNYHHGQLRGALLEAALGILETEGQEALTLRKIAGIVGVSHAAPGHHFPTMRDLLTGLAGIGFTRFDAAMRKERELAKKDPVSQIRAAERGYMSFATSNPALFRLMFTTPMINWEKPELHVPARAARAQLAEICAPAAALRGFNTADEKLALERLVWAQIHGQAHLNIEYGLESNKREQDSPALLDIAGLLMKEN